MTDISRHISIDSCQRFPRKAQVMIWDTVWESCSVQTPDYRTVNCAVCKSHKVQRLVRASVTVLQSHHIRSQISLDVGAVHVSILQISSNSFDFLHFNPEARFHTELINKWREVSGRAAPPGGKTLVWFKIQGCFSRWDLKDRRRSWFQPTQRE